jgi:REP element-mobilizing transposase RayT
LVTFRKYDPEIHHRRSIRLQNWDYSNAGSYFVTFNLGDQTVQLGRIESGKMYYNDYGVIVVNTWLDLPNHYDNVRLDEFRVMLDHVHGIVFIKTSIATKDSINAINTDAKLVDVMHVGAIHESPRQTEQKKQREQQNESQHNQRNLMDYCNRRR